MERMGLSQVNWDLSQPDLLGLESSSQQAMPRGLAHGSSLDRDGSSEAKEVK